VAGDHKKILSSKPVTQRGMKN